MKVQIVDEDGYAGDFEKEQAEGCPPGAGLDLDVVGQGECEKGCG